MSFDYEQDPELYGLRRSRRAHVAPKLYTESDEEEDRRRARRVNREEDFDMNDIDEFDGNLDEDEMDVDEEDYGDGLDASYGGPSSRRRPTQTSKRSKSGTQSSKKRKVSNKSNGYDDDIGLDSSSAQIRFSTRNSRAVNYNIDQEDDFEEDEVEEWEYVDDDGTTSLPREVAPVDSIDQVLDHREAVDESKNVEVKKEKSDRIGEDDEEEAGTRSPSSNAKQKLEFYVSTRWLKAAEQLWQD